MIFQDVCGMSQDIGPCKGRFTKWSFDAQGLDSIHVENIMIFNSP